jgi:hypothetical protein
MGHEPLGSLLALPAVVALIWLTWREMGRRHWARSAAVAILAAIPLYASVMQFTFPRIEALWIGPRIEALLAREAPGLPSEKFGITGHAEPSTLFHVGSGVQLLGRGEDAVLFLVADGGRVVAVGDRAEADFRREAAQLGLRLEEMGSVNGLNYSRGRRVTLRFYRVAAP